MKLAHRHSPNIGPCLHFKCLTELRSFGIAHLGSAAWLNSEFHHSLPLDSMMGGQTLWRRYRNPYRFAQLLSTPVFRGGTTEYLPSGSNGFRQVLFIKEYCPRFLSPKSSRGFWVPAGITKSISWTDTFTSQLMYYQLYLPNASEVIHNIINMDENGEIHPTGNQQDFVLAWLPLFIFWHARMSTVLSCIVSQLISILDLWLWKTHGELYHFCMLMEGCTKRGCAVTYHSSL